MVIAQVAGISTSVANMVQRWAVQTDEGRVRDSLLELYTSSSRINLRLRTAREPKRSRVDAAARTVRGHTQRKIHVVAAASTRPSPPRQLTRGPGRFPRRLWNEVQAPEIRENVDVDAWARLSRNYARACDLTGLVVMVEGVPLDFALPWMPLEEQPWLEPEDPDAAPPSPDAT